MLEDPGLNKLALKVLEHHAGRDAGAEALAAAAYRAYDDLARASAQLIGQAGVDALTGRALHLAQQQYAWLVHKREPEQPEGPLAQIIACLKRQPPAVGFEATGVVLTIFARLLITFIGKPLTSQLVRKAWPEAFSDEGTEEKQA